MYFKVVMEMGHVGTRKACEISRFFEAEDAMKLLSLLENYPGLKSKKLGTAIKLIQPISRETFEEGKDAQSKDPYYTRLYARYSIEEDCSLESLTEGSPASFDVTAIDYSAGGIGAICKGRDFQIGEKFLVTIASMNIVKREAEVYWFKEPDEAIYLGLSWCGDK